MTVDKSIAVGRKPQIKIKVFFHQVCKIFTFSLALNVLELVVDICWIDMISH